MYCSIIGLMRWFFFFKQKTAYEMRISDWSSDVCSSDLETDGQRALVNGTMLPKDIRGATREQLAALGFEFGADVDELFVQCELPPGWTKRETEHRMKHGRASCRERVCQYV